MKLIFIFGPPASDKLTVAKKLSEHTGIPLFHNHLSRDLVKDIYKDKLRENYALVAIVVIAGILEGAKMNVHYTSLLNVIAEAESRGNYNAYYSVPSNTNIQFTGYHLRGYL
jgi:hypothetical protein